MAADLHPFASFADALRAGIQARGLTLERIQEHLRQRGVSVSLATLSYWQSGRSHPERRESLAAIAGLEEILGLPQDSLSMLLAPPRLRGRPLRTVVAALDLNWPSPDPVKAALSRLGAPYDDHLTRLSLHDRVLIGQSRAERSIRTRQVLRAEQDGVDRFVLIFGLDTVPGSLPRLHVRRPARLGSVVTDAAAGLLVAELVFGRELARGDTVIAEHVVSHLSQGPAVTRFERRFRCAVREYVLEVGFHPAALPQRCWQYAVADGPERMRSVAVDGAHSVHHVALGVGPGRCGIRWQWD